jgi:cytochrome c5
MVMKSFVQTCALLVSFICCAPSLYAADAPAPVTAVPPTDVPLLSKSELRAKYNIEQGKDVYERVCATCHSSGVMDAPKFCDLTDWKPRMAHGMEHMIGHAVNGWNNMPAKGGMESLTVSESANAVAYMVDQCLIESK